MSFSYDKIKLSEESGGNQWTSYSDLFMVLSFIFLLLYVVSSLKNGTESVQNQIAVEQQSKEIAELKEELSVYNVLQVGYLENGATEQEQKTYHEMISKLNFLKEEAKFEKNELKRQFLESQKKENSLNRYQKVIKSIIDANMIAQAKIKKRDDTIFKKQKIIREARKKIREKEKAVRSAQYALKKQDRALKRNEIALLKKQDKILNLQSKIQSKQEVIKENEKRIKIVKNQLSVEIEKVMSAQKTYKTSKIIMKKEISNLKETSAKTINNLAMKNENVSKQLKDAMDKFDGAHLSLQKSKEKIATQSLEKERLLKQLDSEKQQFSTQIDLLKNKNEQEITRAKAAFKKLMEIQSLTKQERARREKEFTAQMKNRANEYQSELSRMKKDLRKANQEKSGIAATVDSLQKEKKRLEGDLKNAKARANAKRAMAKRIKDNFNRHFKDGSVLADVDNVSGDVTLSFAKGYFDIDKSYLKREMMSVLKKFMPVYAVSLFDDKNIAKKIKYVEIVGFASPTYNGKFVDPKSLRPKDRIAINYNLDLSYQRANSIFKFIFDRRKMNYKHQKELLPLLKVTGRSFFSEDIKVAGISPGASIDRYCKKYDCKVARKVILKFSLVD